MFRNRVSRMTGSDGLSRKISKPTATPSPRTLILESPTSSDNTSPDDELQNFDFQFEKQGKGVNTTEPLLHETFLFSEDELTPLTPDATMYSQWRFEQLSAATSPAESLTPSLEDEDTLTDLLDESLPEALLTASTVTYHDRGRAKLVDVPSPSQPTTPTSPRSRNDSRNSSISTHDPVFSPRSSFSSPSTAASSISEYSNCCASSPVTPRSPSFEQAPEIDMKPFRRTHRYNEKSSLGKIEEQSRDVSLT